MKKFLEKNNKGITLIALVITIILLLILTGITISQLTGSGLFQKARLATEETKKSQIQEMIQLAVNDVLIEYISEGKEVTNAIVKEGLINNKTLEGIIVNDDLTGSYEGYEYYIDENRNVHMGKKENEFSNIETKTIKELVGYGKIKEGDYISYNVGNGSQTDENGNYIVTKELTGFTQDQIYNVKTYNKAWRVLSINETNGNIEIFSEDNIFINDKTTTLSLIGKAGYNNYISILNNICRHYINEKYAISARCFGSNQFNPEGTIQKYKNSSYPYIEQFASDLIDEDEDYINDLENIKKIMSEDDLKEKSKDGCILLASREVSANSTNASFRIRSHYYKVDNNSIGETYSYLYGISSNGESKERLQNWCMVVPIITLKPELNVINNDIEHNTEQNKWIIKDVLN